MTIEVMRLAIYSHSAVHSSDRCYTWEVEVEETRNGRARVRRMGRRPMTLSASAFEAGRTLIGWDKAGRPMRFLIVEIFYSNNNTDSFCGCLGAHDYDCDVSFEARQAEAGAIEIAP